VDFTSLPYSKIQAFSIETAGNFDRDAELELWFSGLGKVRLEFKADSDIRALGQMIAAMSSDRGERAVLDRFRVAWLAGDLPGVLACLTEDVVFRTSDGTAHVGRDEVGRAFGDELGADAELTIEPIVVDDGRGFGFWHYPAAADGTTLRGVDVYTVRDGLIAAKDVFSKLD
jgi:ketosteroid isomerase-like protein